MVFYYQLIQLSYLNTIFTAPGQVLLATGKCLHMYILYIHLYTNTVHTHTVPIINHRESK